MSCAPIFAGFDRSWFALSAQKKPQDPEKFIAGLEILTRSPQLAITQQPLVQYAIEQLSSADLKNGSQAERVDEAAQKFFKEWPQVKIGTVAARFPKDLLERSSPKFQALLNTDMREAQNNCISLEAPENGDIPFLVLNFLRTGEIILDDNNVLDLHRFASQHRLELLTRRCEIYLAKQLSMETFSELLECAMKYDLPLLKFASFCFARTAPNNPITFNLLKQQNLFTNPTLFKMMDVGPYLTSEGLAALILWQRFELDAPFDGRELMRKSNQLTPIRLLVIEATHTPMLEEMAKILPDIEELIVNDLSAKFDLSQLKRLFPKLRSFGNRAPFSGNFTQLEEYLNQFALPGQDPSISGKPRLRALNLDKLNKLTQEQTEQLAPYFEELYYLTLKNEHIHVLNLPHALEVKCRECASLRLLSAPQAIKIHCSDCPKLTTLSASRVWDLECTYCSALTSISAPCASRIFCTDCSALRSVLAPHAYEVYLDNLSAFVNLSAMSAKMIQCFKCSALTSLCVPECETIWIRECSGLVSISAPKAYELRCVDSTALASLDTPLISEKIVTKIRAVVASDSRAPSDKYQISVFGIDRLLNEKSIGISADDQLPILNKIPYFQAKILEAVLDKGFSQLSQGNGVEAMHEAAYILGIDPAHLGAQGLMAAARQAQEIAPEVESNHE